MAGRAVRGGSQVICLLLSFLLTLESTHSLHKIRTAASLQAGNRERRSKGVHVDWMRLSGAGSFVPLTREGHSATLLPGTTRRVLVFGGCHLDVVCFNDLVEFDTKSGKWRALTAAQRSPDASNTPVLRPAPRGWHSATLLSDNKIYYFGGSDDQQYSGELLSLSLPSLWWERPAMAGTVPAPREAHSAVPWRGDRVIIFGGYGASGYMGDVWVFDSKVGGWGGPLSLAGSPPAPRSGHAAAMASHDRMVVVGGSNAQHTFADVFVLDMSTRAWLRPNPAVTPSARHMHAFCVVAPNGPAVMAGGCDYRKGECYDDAWALDLASFEWTKLDARVPDGVPGNSPHVQQNGYVNSDNDVEQTWFPEDGAQDDTLTPPLVESVERDIRWGDGYNAFLINNGSHPPENPFEAPAVPSLPGASLSHVEALPSPPTGHGEDTQEADGTPHAVAPPLQVRREGAPGVLADSRFVMFLGCGPHRECVPDVIALDVSSLLSASPFQAPAYSRQNQTATEPSRDANTSRHTNTTPETPPYSFREARLTAHIENGEVSTHSRGQWSRVTLGMALFIVFCVAPLAVWNLRLRAQLHLVLALVEPKIDALALRGPSSAQTSIQEPRLTAADEVC